MSCHYTLVGFKKTIEQAFTPKRATHQAAGLDIRSPSDYIIHPKSIQLIDSGLRLYLPVNTYGRIAGRSSLALNYFIDILGGVVDNDYTGSVKIMLANHGSEDFHIARGDKIAQIIIERVYIPKLVEIKSAKKEKSNNPEHITRGDSGFGSTGR